MAITTYAELQTAVQNFAERPGDDVTDYIMLAEARLNRELDAVETNASLTGTIGSRSIDVSSLSIVESVVLFLVDSNGDETEMFQMPDGEFPYSGDSGEPNMWSHDGNNIIFDVLLDAAYSFRYRYQERFTLSDSAPTNWLLTNHPDIYLAATMMWGLPDKEDWANASGWKRVLDEGMLSVRHVIAKSKRARLRIDPALGKIGGYFQ